MKLLLVEDDRELRRTLGDALTLEGYEVLPAASLADARLRLRRALGQERLDLVLLDLGLPDGEGESLLAELRATQGLPVIVISARADDEAKIRLLDNGADDYLVKPFGLGELLARLRVALRHRGTTMPPAVLMHDHDGLRVDLARHEVLLHGQEVKLTPTEFRLLARLVRSAGQVVTHRQLLTDVWGAEHSHDTHYLRLYMAQLRGKLEDEPAEPQRLLTETGVGYRLHAPAG